MPRRTSARESCCPTTKLARPRDDAGVSLIEVLVAVVLLVIVLLPTTIFVIQGERTVSEQHLKAEAINLATSRLESLQLDAAKGQLPTGATSTTSLVAESGTAATKFNVTTSWRTVVQGTNQSICSASASVAQQIWLVTAKVTWGNMNGMSPVVQSTEIAPAAAGAVQQFAGELAIRLDNLVAPQDLYLGTATATVTGTWTGPSGTQPTVPSSQYTTETASSGRDGCIVFQNLDAEANSSGSWSYDVSLASNPTLVSGDEHSDSNPNGALNIGNISLVAGVPTIENVQIDSGTAVTISYTTPAGACTSPALPVVPPITSSSIPISVENTFLSSYPGDTWTASSTLALDSVLLYPWSGATSIWAGSQQTGNPATYGTGTPCSIATNGAALTVDLPVYPLKIVVTSAGATSVPSSLTATEVSGATAQLALNMTTAALVTTSATSIPLGEYALSASGTSGPLTLGTAYVWVTPAGECSDVAVSAGPPAVCNSSSLPVVAS